MNMGSAQFLHDTAEPPAPAFNEPHEQFTQAALDELIEDDDLVSEFVLDNQAVYAYVRNHLREPFAQRYDDVLRARAVEMEAEDSHRCEAEAAADYSEHDRA